jgi:hypothetical protein
MASLRKANKREGKPVAAKRKHSLEAVGYLRTSSATNVGRDKDSDKRQRVAIEGFATAHDYIIVDRFYDAAVTGADALQSVQAFGRCLIASRAMACALSSSSRLTGLPVILQCS